VRALAGQAIVLASAGFTRAAERVLEAASQEIGAEADPALRAHVLVYSGAARLICGATRDSIAPLTEGEALGEAAGEALLPFYSRFWLNEAHHTLGEMRAALAVADRQLASARASRIPGFECVAHAQRMRGLVWLGRIDDARAEIGPAVESLRVPAGSVAIPAAGIHSMEGEILARDGDLRGALDCLKTSISILERRRRFDLHAYPLVRYAEIALALAAAGDPPLEPRHLDRAVARAVKWARRFAIQGAAALRLEALRAGLRGLGPTAERLFQEALARAESRGELKSAVETLEARAACRDRARPGSGDADRARAAKLRARLAS
jgi:hypothetical protein